MDKKPLSQKVCQNVSVSFTLSQQLCRCYALEHYTDFSAESSIRCSNTTDKITKTLKFASRRLFEMGFWLWWFLLLCSFLSFVVLVWLWWFNEMVILWWFDWMCFRVIGYIWNNREFWTKWKNDSALGGGRTLLLHIYQRQIQTNTQQSSRL